MIDTNGTALHEESVEFHELRRQYEDNLELLTERLAELELAQDEQGWARLGSEGNAEFTRSYLKRIAALSRIMFLKSPLINRAVSLQAFYVFGQGTNITAATPEVNEIIQEFLEDPKNKAELTSQQARTHKEQTLQVDGNVFFVLFANKITGRVRVRTIAFDEITDIICNPEDAREVWYYRREWTARNLDLATGNPGTIQEIAYYPDWRYQRYGARGADHPTTIGGRTIHWDTPVYHVKVGGLDGMRFGVPETYAALDWARAYKSFLEDWATITRAYSRFAWKMSTPGGSKAVAAAKARLGTTIGNGLNETNPAPTTGSTFVSGAPGVDMTPIRTAGATTSAADGRQLLLMVAAATGLPEFFFGDANVGNRATATILDRPTELKFVDRQTLWSDTHQDILQYVIDQSALAPKGKLQGTLILPEPGDDAEPYVELVTVTGEIDKRTGKQQDDAPMDRTINVDFPPILTHSIAESITAIVTAATMNGHSAIAFDQKTTTRLMLQTFGIEDIDEAIEAMFPETPEGELDPFSQVQAPAPKTPTLPSGQQQPPPVADPNAPPPADPNAQQPAREAAVPSHADLAAEAEVGPEDAARAARLWKAANPDALTDLLNAEPEGE